MQPILVTGGTGTLGRHVVSRLQDAGCVVRVLSRSQREAGHATEIVIGDLATGEGIDAAVEGTEIIVHCAGSSKGDEEKALNLIRAVTGRGVRHLVYISVVGADRIPVVSGIDRAIFGYFASKRAAERIVIDSGIPWTILRVTQFHDLLITAAQGMEKLPIMPALAGFRFQPIDTDEVAARLVQLTLDEPAGLVPDMGGPQVYTMAELLRAYLHVRQRRRLILPLWLPGQAARAHRAGANLARNHAVGHRTWEAFLADRVQPSREASSSLA